MAAHTEQLILQWEGRSRSTDVFAPTTTTDAPLPVVIMLHGGGGTSDLAIKQTKLCDKAQSENFIAVFPNGVPLKPDRPPSFLRNPRVWNSGVDRGIPYSLNTDDVGFINYLIDELSQRYALDQSKIFVAGFSNGGGMAFRLGIELSERIAAIAPICAHLSLKDSLHQKTPVPALVIACADDPMVPLDGGLVRDIWTRAEIDRPSVRQSVQRYAALSGCSPTPLEKVLKEGVVQLTYSYSASNTPFSARDKKHVDVQFVIVSDAGHVYPGGAPMLSERIAGKATNKIFATDLLWEFFAKQRRTLA